MPEPHSHLFRVEVEVDEVTAPLELVMPSWTPGSYLLREFARNVQQFRAEDGAGSTLNWTKTDKNTWRMGRPGDGRLRVRYAVYADELTVRTSHLDASHGYVNGAGVFMYVAGREDQSLYLTIEPPTGWKVTTSLPHAGEPNHFRATDYHQLVDSPIEIGTHQLLEWEVEGKPHRYAIWGRGNYNSERLIADTRRIIIAARALWGSLPYDEYTFLLHLVPGGGGGLEHRNGCSLQIDRWSFRGRDYEKFLALIAHEFFHLWNGKRIRPEPLYRIDYTRENYTRALWMTEGITTYYTDLLLRRAGIITPERYLERLGEMIERMEMIPGRNEQTLADSSFDTWIKFYRPDANTPNAQISYYQKGALVGLLLDLEIRRATENRGSLDEVMRRLWTKFGAPEAPLSEGRGRGIEAVAAEVSGQDLTPFFDRFVRGTAELPYDEYLRAAGVRLQRLASDREDAATSSETGKESAERPDDAGGLGRAAEPIQQESGGERVLGMRLKPERSRTIVAQVLAGTAAYRAGVNAGDELVAVGGLRANAASLPSRIAECRPGESVVLTVFRRDELLSLPIMVESSPFPTIKLTRLPNPTELQHAIFQSWLGTGESETAAP